MWIARISDCFVFYGSRDWMNSAVCGKDGFRKLQRGMICNNYWDNICIYLSNICVNTQMTRRYGFLCFFGHLFCGMGFHEKKLFETSRELQCKRCALLCMALFFNEWALEQSISLESFRKFDHSDKCFVCNSWGIAYEPPWSRRAVAGRIQGRECRKLGGVEFWGFCFDFFQVFNFHQNAGDILIPQFLLGIHNFERKNWKFCFWYPQI